MNHGQGARSGGRTRDFSLRSVKVPKTLMESNANGEETRRVGFLLDATQV